MTDCRECDRAELGSSSRTVYCKAPQRPDPLVWAHQMRTSPNMCGDAGRWFVPIQQVYNEVTS